MRKSGVVLAVALAGLVLVRVAYAVTGAIYDDDIEEAFGTDEDFDILYVSGSDELRLRNESNTPILWVEGATDAIKTISSVDLSDTSAGAITSRLSLTNPSSTAGTGSGILLRAHDSGSAATNYGGLSCELVDATDTSEDGRVHLRAMIAGTLTDVVDVDALGVTIKSGMGIIGVDDTSAGGLTLYGSATGGGGSLAIYNPGDQDDGNADYFHLLATTTGTLELRQVKGMSNPAVFTHDPSTGLWSFSNNFAAEGEVITFGEDDLVRATVRLYPDDASDCPSIFLQNAPDVDDQTSSWYIQGDDATGDFEIYGIAGTSNLGAVLTFDETTGDGTISYDLGVSGDLLVSQNIGTGANADIIQVVGSVVTVTENLVVQDGAQGLLTVGHVGGSASGIISIGAYDVISGQLLIYNADDSDTDVDDWTLTGDDGAGNTGDFLIEADGVAKFTIDAATFLVALVDDLLVDGGNIGLTADADLLSLASGALTVNGTVTTTGDIDVKGGDIQNTTGALTLKDTLVTVVDGGDSVLSIGTLDTYFGTLYLAGDGDATGGQARVYNAANKDGTHNYFQFEASDTYVAFGVNGATDKIQFQGDGDIQLDGNVLVDGGNVGITADADLLTLANTLLTVAGSMTLNKGAATILWVGQSDTHQGEVSIGGDNDTAGAKVHLYNAANEDTNANHYTFEAAGDYLALFEDSNEKFQFQYDGDLYMAGNLDVNGGTISSTGGGILIQDGLTVNTGAGATGIAAGQNDTYAGSFTLYGDNNIGGSTAIFYNAANEDTTHQYFAFEACDTYLSFGVTGATDKIQLQGDGDLQMDGDVFVDGGQIGMSGDTDIFTMVADTSVTVAVPAFTVDGNATSSIKAGQADTDQGQLVLYGNNGTAGGKIYFSNAADEDGTYDSYIWEPQTNYLTFGTNVSADKIKLYGNGDAQFDGDLDVDGGDIDIGDAGGFSGFKFDGAELEFWIDGAQVASIHADGTYNDDV